MFGFGFKEKVENIIEEHLGYSVSRMFRNRFNSIVKEGKSLSKNEYATAIFYVIHIAEHQYETWSDENGNITNEVIIEQIQSLCESIETIIHLSNGSETESIERAKILLSKI